MTLDGLVGLRTGLVLVLFIAFFAGVCRVWFLHVDACYLPLKNLHLFSDFTKTSLLSPFVTFPAVGSTLGLM